MKGQCVIEANDVVNIIKAMGLYNRFCTIIAINGIKFDEETQSSLHPLLVGDQLAQPLTINYQTSGHLGAPAVFPVFHAIKTSMLPGFYEEDIKAVCHYAKNLDSNLLLMIEPNWAPPTLRETPAHPDVVLCLANEIYKRYPFVGLIHLPSLEKIILQTEVGSNIVLDYSEYKTSMCVFEFGLDLNVGFYATDGIASSTKIVKVLNDCFFTPWKANHYKGEIFPRSKAGLEILDDLKKDKIEREMARFKDQFNDLLDTLKIKTDELEEKGKHFSRYKLVGEAAHALAATLQQANSDFFSGAMPLNKKIIDRFKEVCIVAITKAKNEFKNHRDIWWQIHPILKSIMGVLAVLTVLPALIVATKSPYGYVKTFFSKCPTDSESKLTSFQNQLTKKEGVFDSCDEVQNLL